jgi:hypothetical protein
VKDPGKVSTARLIQTCVSLVPRILGFEEPKTANGGRLQLFYLQTQGQTNSEAIRKKSE